MLQKPDWDLNEVGKTLWAAANYMEEHGHVKGVLRDEQGRVCLLGAINMVVFGKESMHSRAAYDDPNITVRCKASRAVKDLLRDKLGTEYIYGEVYWNNQPERTKDEVVQVLRDAALTCKVTA